jgi:subtilisin family serine protease
MKTPRILFLSIVLALGGCGGASTEPTSPEPVASTPSGGETTETASAASPWASTTREGLVALVREQAAARVREAQPELDLTQLAAWASDPSSAPDLADRTAEQLMNLAIAEAAAGETARAQGLVRLVRAKARNRNNAYVGSTLLAELARRSSESDPAPAVRAVFEQLPRNRFGAATVVFQLFQDERQIDARVEQLHGQLLSLDTAVSALFYDGVLRTVVANRDTFLGAIEAVRTAHASQPEQRPYAFSTVDLTRARDAQPVTVAVWDTGVAGNLFASQLFTNERETLNGQDDDGNGLVDDRHGVVSDPTEGQTGLTFEPGDEVLREYAPFLRGIMDLRAGMASTEAAQRVLTLMRSAQNAEALERLETNLDAVGEWAHGTHVAGIMLAGVPQARVAVFRSAWAGEARLYHQRGPTDEELAAELANVEDIARFIRAHGVRVVNASLGFSRDYVEGALRHESERYPTDEAVRERARQIHAARAAAWRRVFELCPETLFVVAAGNSSRDVVEYEDVPASFELPNVLIVGAVDRFGDWATFTNSNPQRVRVFDHGVEVDSLIPNGERVPLSGTSMASPNVANLATKMIALDPTLTPQRAITIIEETGEPIAAPFNGRIAHEERAIARVRRERPRRTTR